MRAKPQTSRTG